MCYFNNTLFLFISYFYWKVYNTIREVELKGGGTMTVVVQRISYVDQSEEK
jgi:hypothetical protein